MNADIEQEYRKRIKDCLAKLPESSHRVFKWTYSYVGQNEDINDTVDNIGVDKLDAALTQVQRSLETLQHGGNNAAITN